MKLVAALVAAAVTSLVLTAVVAVVDVATDPVIRDCAAASTAMAEPKLGSLPAYVEKRISEPAALIFVANAVVSNGPLGFIVCKASFVGNRSEKVFPVM